MVVKHACVPSTELSTNSQHWAVWACPHFFPAHQTVAVCAALTRGWWRCWQPGWVQHARLAGWWRSTLWQTWRKWKEKCPHYQVVESAEGVWPGISCDLDWDETRNLTNKFKAAWIQHPQEIDIQSSASYIVHTYMHINLVVCMQGSQLSLALSPGSPLNVRKHGNGLGTRLS